MICSSTQTNKKAATIHKLDETRKIKSKRQKYEINVTKTTKPTRQKKTKTKTKIIEFLSINIVIDW